MDRARHGRHLWKLGIFLTAFAVIIIVTVVFVARPAPVVVVVEAASPQVNALGKPNPSPPSPNPNPNPLQELTVDYLIAGGGPAGLQTAVDLSQALRNTGVSK